MNAGKDGSIKESYFYRHLHFATSLLEKYDGKEPFHLYLKKYFSQNKKHGSRDRKEITALCYDYFRAGCGFSKSLSLRDKLVTAAFMLRSQPFPLLEKENPGWNERINEPLPSKLTMVKDIFDVQKIYPFNEYVSEVIDLESFGASFLIQPNLFVRIRPGKMHRVMQKLEAAQIKFESYGENCLAFPNNSSITDVLKLNADAVIQDVSSQNTGELLKGLASEKNMNIWDCCAASGGKSILAFDLLNSPNITVTDARTGILKNLATRFQQAGIKKYHAAVANLTHGPAFADATFDLIIADVPCSGSGTWARTPEQLQYFDSRKIKEYAALQREITFNALKSLKQNGYFLYITCSVFYAENEENTKWLCEQGLQLLEQQYFVGYDKKADTLFASLFQFND